MNAIASSDSTIRPGTFLAEKYRVERVLGQGGMGIVVAAMHLQLRQRVAIKLLLPEMARDDKIVARFLQEARAQVRIQGDHVVRVLDVASLPCGAPMMVMELLDGSDLSAVIESRGGLPAAEAIDYLLQACEAIAQAHSLGIIHRDLKPQNMFLTSAPDGSPLVKVLDFGISKTELLAGATRRAATTEGGLLGSPAYMSPEQIKNAKGVTQRSDIWALGVILYELLTGEMPFMATTLGGLLAAIATEPPVDIRKRRTDLPENVAHAVMRCLARDPDARPRDVAELALSLVIDATSHARAMRVASIVRRFEALPPPSTHGSLANAATLADGSSATLFAATVEDRREPPPPRLTRRRTPTRIGIGVAFASVLATCVAIGVLALTRTTIAGPPIATNVTATSATPITSSTTPAITSATSVATAAPPPPVSASASPPPRAKLVRSRAAKAAPPILPTAAPAATENDLYDTRK